MTQLRSTIAKLTDEDTEEYVLETLLEAPYDDDTIESVRGTLMELLSPQFAGEGAVLCDFLFALVDEIGKQQKQGNIITATPPSETSSTNTIRPRLKTKKTHTPPTDQ